MKDQTNKPPTFLSAISTIILGIMLVGFGSFVMLFVNYFAFISVGLGAVILCIGVLQWKQFIKEVELQDTESGETYDREHSFGTRKTKSMYNSFTGRIEDYDEETLAEKRP